MPMTSMETGLVEQVLRMSAFTYYDEASLQDAISQALTRAALTHTREVRLSRHDRVDFMVGRTAIEVKVAGSWTALAQQVQRYAASPDVDAIIVVTTRATHTMLPDTLGGKPVIVRFLGGAR